MTEEQSTREDSPAHAGQAWNWRESAAGKQADSLRGCSSRTNVNYLEDLSKALAVISGAPWRASAKLNILIPGRLLLLNANSVEKWAAASGVCVGEGSGVRLANEVALQDRKGWVHA